MTEKAGNRKGWIAWVLVLGVFVVLGTTSIDLVIARELYSHEEGWYLGQEWLPTVLYDYAPWIGASLATGSLLALILQFPFPRLKPHRRFFAILCLTYIIGPGLIVNTTLKPLVGRSRPRNLVEFGGRKGEFEPVFSMEHHGGRTSFPSGHASAGFYLVTPAFPLRRRRPRLARVIFAGGILMGLLMGLGRMLQGGHFLSDVVAAGMITVATAAIVTYFVERRGSRPA